MMSFSFGHLIRVSTWFRIFFTLILYYIVQNFFLQLVFLVSIIQLLSMLFFGQPIIMLASYCRGVMEYCQDVLLYLLFLSENRPYPLNYIPDDIEYYQRLFSKG